MGSDFEPGGGRYESVRSLLQGGSPGRVAIRGRDVIPDPQYGAGHEKLSAQGRTTDHQEASKETGGWELGLSSNGCGNGGSGL